jgi:ribose transport system substrate-binding protein
MRHRLFLALIGVHGLCLVLTGCTGGDKAGSSSDLDLGNGFKLIATKTDESRQDVCQAHAEDLLNKRPSVGCLVGLWEYNPPALLRAVKGSGKKVPIVGFDENDQTLAGIQDGSVVGTVVQDPYQFGYQSIKVLAALVKGKDDVLKDWPGLEKGNSIFVPHRVITRDNVDDFKAEVKKILADQAAGGGQSGKPKVAFVSNNAYQFWTFAERGAEKAAAEFGVDMVFKKPSDGSAKVQREIIQDLINSGYQGIAVSPSDSKNALSFFKDEVAPKVALVTTDNDLTDPSARKCYIGTHNYRAGRAAGDLVKKALPKGGEIAIFVGQMDAQNAIERRQGVLDVLAGKERKDMGEVTPVR